MTDVYEGPVTDACVFHHWSSVSELAPYLNEGWRQLVMRPGDPGGPNRVAASPFQSNPMGAKALSSYGEKAAPGTSLEMLQEQVLDAGGIERAVLGYDDGLMTAAYYNRYAALQMTRAANDWTAEEWLSRDERLYGMILIVSQLPDEAAAEIRRMAGNERMVAVALGVNGLANLFGHPVYYPIYEAASEAGLPIVLQVGSDLAANQITSPIGGGLPATFGEYRALGAHAIMSHVGNMIFEGVFAQFPDLRLLIVGGGATWVPGFLWRFNFWYKMDLDELPSAKGFPLDYFRDHVRVSTYGLESPQPPERLAQALGTLPFIDDTLMYASGYPNSDFEDAPAIADRLPESWHRKAFSDNASSFFRWPTAVANATSTDKARVGGPHS